MDLDDSKAERVTIDLDVIITRSDGTQVEMREFVKEMLHYNPNFEITSSPDKKTWYLNKAK